MSGFGFESVGEEVIADLGFALVEAVVPASRVVSFAPSILAHRVAVLSTTRLAQRVVSFKE